MKTIFFLVGILFLTACKGEIKNDDPKISVEEGTYFSQVENETDPSAETTPRNISHSQKRVNDACLGFWIGDFEPDKLEEDEEYGKSLYLGESYYWSRNNKINISIDEIIDDSIIGHSVVAGNNRPFVGKILNFSEDIYTIEVEEPGDDKYDGIFSFTISRGKMMGKWEAFKAIDISNRKYELTRRTFQYDPSIQLTYAKPYANWKKVSKEKTIEKSDDEIYEWIEESYAGSTDQIYEINASEKLLKAADVENLKRGDLQIIRNTIYARHGYSFKGRVYRVFFDAQPWYIPVHTDIKKELTEIEKKNIQLLLRYEKNAVEYYDYFGRG